MLAERGPCSKHAGSRVERLRERIAQYQQELEAERERRVAEHRRQMVERARTAADPFGVGDAQHAFDFDSSWDL